jgi:hypothetical protein
MVSYFELVSQTGSFTYKISEQVLGKRGKLALSEKGTL